jgi:hypothetical protein
MCKQCAETKGVEDVEMKDVEDVEKDVERKDDDVHMEDVEVMFSQMCIG